MYNLHHEFLRRMFPEKRRKIGQEIDAYLAGYFDGEGSVSILSWNKQKPWLVQIRITATNTHRQSLKTFQMAYGGKIRRARKKGPHNKACYYWIAVAKDAHWALCHMLPWLQIKRRKASAACSLLANRPPMDKYGSRAYSERQKALAVKLLKRHGFIKIGNWGK